MVSYDPETCRLVGRIVNVCADESILGENGQVDPGKLQPITYDPMNHTYLTLGEKVGSAFKDSLALKESSKTNEGTRHACVYLYGTRKNHPARARQD